jgi:hypothetical protein
MAKILHGGNAALQAYLYGDVDPGTERYFQSQRGRAFDRISDGARRFFERAKEAYGFMDSERTKRLIQDVRRRADWMFHGDYVRPLRTFEEIRDASPTMRRYIMADPFLMRRFRTKQSAGYDGGYKDLFPSFTPEDHPDYQRVMNNVLVITDEVDEHGEDVIYATEYLPLDYENEEPELSMQEQLDIQAVWAINQRLILNGGRDPQSLADASLD